MADKQKRIISAEQEIPNYQKASFEFQLEILKNEIQIINQTMGRLDQMTQAIKNWMIVIWGGSIAVVFGEPDLRKYVIFTAVLPILFWYSDALWRYYVSQFVYRERKISEFLNSDKLLESFRLNKLVEFTVLDPASREYRKTIEFKKSVRFWRGFWNGEVSLLYVGLITISIGLGSYFILFP